MNPSGPSQVTLLPEQLGRLAEQFPKGGAVGISQEGSVVTADNGKKSVTVNAQGHILKDPNQETFPLC